MCPIYWGVVYRAARVVLVHKDRVQILAPQLRSIRAVCEHVFVPCYTESEARDAIAESLSYAETLRRLGLCATGGNWRTLRMWTERWSIPTEHFDPNASNAAAARQRARPLEEILVQGSTYSRGSLKRRLWASGLKPRQCELCGQGELWHGSPMGLILDHANGQRDDNRLENLRIVCPNCAATLDTHCGRKNRQEPERICERCDAPFRPNRPQQRYCSQACGTRAPRPKGQPNFRLRRVERPPYDQLMREIAATSYLAVGRRYGVSDNAIRKWVRQYQREVENRAAMSQRP
jgi:HNH endonuclease